MPGGSFSLVHNKETSLHESLGSSYGACLRQHCADEFRQAERAYELLDARKDRTRADILRGCRSNAWFTRNISTGEVHVASNACHLRWCPVCAEARRRYVSFSVSAWLEKADHPKFLTLTLKHSTTELHEQLDRLYASFVELRRRKGFKAKVTGGIWFLHIKKSKHDHLWHPHLHCLVTGLYISRRFLSHTWTQITTDSVVIDIRAVHDSESAAHDAAKYVAKPGSLTDVPLDDVLELVQATHGRRLSGTWGMAHSLRLRPPPIADKSQWQNIGSWLVVTGMMSEDQSAKAIFYAWRTGTPLGPGIDCRHADDLIAGKMTEVFANCDWDKIYFRKDVPP